MTASSYVTPQDKILCRSDTGVDGAGVVVGTKELVGSRDVVGLFVAVGEGDVIGEQGA